MSARIDPAAGTASSRERRRWAVIVVALALGFGLLEALQGRYRYLDIPWSRWWPEALIRTLPGWLSLAALVPAIVWMARHARVDRVSWPRMLPLQALAGVAFVFVHTAASAAIIAAIRQRPDRSFVLVFDGLFYRYAATELFTYLGIVAALHAIHWHAEARQREVAASELRGSLARARLEALRSQLDPHFLFNALNSISVLALEGEREPVARALSGLADVLRMSLGERATQEITLAAELDVLDRYLEIERLRFGDRLTVERRIEPATLEARVPSLLLQPLVENAVRHGVANRRGAGRIVIESRRAGGALRLEVRDSGAGFAAEPEREGIGLANTRARLQQLYGEAQRLELGAAPEGGARVTVTLPFVAAPAAGDAP